MDCDQNIIRETEPKKEMNCDEQRDKGEDRNTNKGRESCGQEDNGQTSHLQQDGGEHERDSEDHGHSSEGNEPSDTTRYNPVDTGWSWVILMYLTGVHTELSNCDESLLEKFGNSDAVSLETADEAPEIRALKSHILGTAVFIVQLISAGFMRALGVVFVAIQMTFLSSASMIALIGGVQCGVFSITALVCMSVLLEVLSVRRATLIGAFVGLCGLAASCLASDVHHLIVSLSVCIGISMGMAIAPGFVLLNAYFLHKLPLATAVANTGGSIGSVVMPIATRMLIDEYYLSGAFLMLGGIFAQMLVFGSLLTPPDEYAPKKSSDHELGLSKEDRLQQQQLLARKKRWERSRQRAVSESAVTGANSNQESNVSSGKECLTKCVDDIDDQEVRHRRSRSLRVGQEGSKKDLTSVNALLMATSVGGSHSISLSTLDLDANMLITSSGLLQGVFNNGNAECVKCSSHSLDSSQESFDEAVSGYKMVSQKLSRMFHPALFRSVVFWLLAVYHYTGGLVCGLPAAYLPALAQEKGLTPTQGALLLTISGGLDILSRLVPGILAQSGWVKPQTSVLVSLLVLGVLFQFTAVVEGMMALTLVSVVYGLFAGVFFSMLPLILLDFGDFNTFRQLFGFTQLSIGIGGVTGFPIVGYLKDTSGSYVTSFHFMGACGLVATVLLFVMPVLQRREAARRGSIPMSDKATETNA